MACAVMMTNDGELANKLDPPPASTRPYEIRSEVSRTRAAEASQLRAGSIQAPEPGKAAKAEDGPVRVTPLSEAENPWLRDHAGGRTQTGPSGTPHVRQVGQTHVEKSSACASVIGLKRRDGRAYRELSSKERLAC